MRYQNIVPSQLPAIGQVHIVLLVVQAVPGVSDIVHKRRYADAVVDIGAERSLWYR